MNKTEQHRLRGTIITLIGVLLMLAAVLLTVFNLWDEHRAEKSVEIVLDGILDEMERGTPEKPVLDFDWCEEAEMPTVVLDDGCYLGILEIPELSLTLPIRDTWSRSNIRKTPCRYSGGLYSHDMVIAGHNYDSHFGRLNALQEGDEVIFTDMDKNRLLYRVTKISVLKPSAIDEMTAVGEWDLTLFTRAERGRGLITMRCTMQEWE